MVDLVRVVAVDVDDPLQELGGRLERDAEPRRVHVRVTEIQTGIDSSALR